VDELDFDLALDDAGKDDGHRAAVLTSPAGEARATVQLPVGARIVDPCLVLMNETFRATRRAEARQLLPLDVAVSGQPANWTAGAFGEALFDAVFGSGLLRDRYEASRGIAIQQAKRLRFKLRLGAPTLAALPWELLYDPRRQEYLALSRSLSLARYLEVARPVTPVRVEPPLRVLGLVARPGDLNQLDTDEEKRWVEEALAPVRARGLVELSWVPGQTWRALQAALRAGPWHVLHFMGHAGIDANGSFIALADEDTGRVDGLPAKALGRFLDGHPSLRLVVLNACEGARESSAASFGSLATTLVRSGVPAVVAMQCPVGDAAAIEFAHTFYAAIADGWQVDAAVGEARVALSRTQPKTWAWAIPVLHLRAADALLFAPPPRNTEDRASKGTGSGSPTFETHVSGGQVGQIINVGTIGTLHLGQPDERG
jgi:hypothetical protein